MNQKLTSQARIWRFVAVALLVAAIPVALAAQDPVMKVEDSIVKVFGTTTAGSADILIFSANNQDAVLGMGEGPDFAGLNTNALIFGYNGNAEVGSGFIGTRPTSGSGRINIYIKNTKEAEFTSSGINLSAGNDYRVNGVSLNVPDYVFADDYPLMPIEDLARFVTEERHLPGIPSEDEVKAGSLGLGGFQMKLLEKIEELTLYTIDQQEKLAAAEERNSGLEARLAALEAKLEAIDR